jgi:CRP-like cAMP-binding protein
VTRRTDLAQLAGVPLFSACDDRALAALDRLVERYDAADGEVVVREGEPGSALYVLVDGTAVVARAGAPVAVLGAGQYFGELAVLDGGPRNATVTMTSAGRVLVVQQRELFGLLDAHPEVARRLLLGLARRLHEADAAS